MSEQAPVPQSIQPEKKPVEITPPPAPIPQPEKLSSPKLVNPEEKKPVSPPMKYNSEFTPQVAKNLISAGINIEYVNPTPIGQGANHMVYLYREPGQPDKVIKLAKTKSFSTMTDGKKGEEENITIAESYFSRYATPTEVKSGKNQFYCVVQELVEGIPLSNINSKGNQNILDQLTEIVIMNNKLFHEKKICLDFAGMSGFVNWFKSQLGRLILRKSVFPVSNIIVDKNGRLKIIDFEYFNLGKKVGLKRKILNWLGMTINRILMKHYFNLDIKR